MSAPTPEVLTRWLREVTALAVSLTPDAARDADANMLVFAMAEARAGGVSSTQLDDFLITAYRHWSRTLSSRGPGIWFYAWHDEMSGTLRVSVCRVSTAMELPFTCRLDIATAPHEVTTAALGSPYSRGVPADELVPVTAWNAQDDDDEEFALTVFAKPLVWVPR